MKKVPALCAVLALGLAASTQEAKAIGCISGGAAGGVAGHYAGHHAVLGALGGCVAGHYANKYQQNRAATANSYEQEQQTQRFNPADSATPYGNRPYQQ